MPDAAKSLKRLVLVSGERLTDRNGSNQNGRFYRNADILKGRLLGLTIGADARKIMGSEPHSREFHPIAHFFVTLLRRFVH